MTRTTTAFTEDLQGEPTGQPVMAASREIVRATLILRLAGKGLGDNETDLFIQDVRRTVSGAPGPGLQTVQWQLRLLGWRAAVTDYGTLSLVQACYPDDGPQSSLIAAPQNRCLIP